MHTLSGQNIYGFKNLFTHLDKGCRNAHPFSRFSTKKFYLVKDPFTYLELEGQNAPYF